MTELTKGANAPLTSPTIELAVAGAAADSVDLMVFQLTDTRRVRSDADFVFFNQPNSPEGAVRLTGADRVSVQLGAVPPDIAVLAVAVALDDSVTGSLASIPGLAVTVSGGSDYTAPASGFTSERAAVLVEVYRRGADWKVRNVSAGWAAGLSALATEHGVSVDDAPESGAAQQVTPPAAPTQAAPPPAPAQQAAFPPPPGGSPASPFPPPAQQPGAPVGFPPPAQPTTPASPFPPPTGQQPSGQGFPPPTGAPAAAPPPQQSAPPQQHSAPPQPQAPPQQAAPSGPPQGGQPKVDLGKRTGAVNLTKGQRVQIDPSELIVASISWPAATDYDVYALVRYADGHTEAVSAFGTKENPHFSLSSADGAVRHAGDVGRSGGGGMFGGKKKGGMFGGLKGAVSGGGLQQTAVERIEIRPHAGIRAIVPVAYSAQSNGTGSFRRYQVSMSIDNGKGTTVRIDAPNADNNDRIYTCVPGIIHISDQGITIDYLEQYSAPNSERRPTIDGNLQVMMDTGELNLYK